MKKRECALCGGKLNENGICAECGYDNSATLKNSRKSSTGINPGYVILIVSAVIFTLISIGIIRTNLKTGFEYSYVLGPGIHHVGSDIPAGKYHIQLEKGDEGAMELYGFDDDVFYGISSSHFLAKHNRERNSYFIKKECYIVIGPGTELGFYTNDNNELTGEQAKTSYTETYTLSKWSEKTGSGWQRAGKDFPAGVYDIVYTPDGSGNNVTVQFTVLNPISDKQETLFEGSITFKAADGEQIFTGIPMASGSTITVSRDSSQIELRTTEYTSQQFYDLTWGYTEE